MTNDSVGKVAQMTGTLYATERYKDEFPLAWNERDYRDYCTDGVPAVD